MTRDTSPPRAVVAIVVPHVLVGVGANPVVWVGAAHPKSKRPTSNTVMIAMVNKENFNVRGLMTVFPSPVFVSAFDIELSSTPGMFALLPVPLFVLSENAVVVDKIPFIDQFIQMVHSINSPILISRSRDPSALRVTYDHAPIC
jgi:hypothetical protein